jgi:hypothetical protein
MNRELDLAEFALPKISLNIIKVLNWWVSDCSFKVLEPFTSIISIATVEYPDLIYWEYDFKGIYSCGSSL